MTSEVTVQLSQTAYRALLERNEELEDRLEALEADDGSRIPHPVALAIIGGESPIVAFRTHRGLTLRDLARRAGISPSYLSEIERRRKPGSTATLAKIAAALNTTIDTLLAEAEPG